MEVLQQNISTRQTEIDEFFFQYATRFNQALREERTDVDDTANAFAKCFIEANPRGVTCGDNDAQFRKIIRQGHAFYRSIGMTDMEIISKEIIGLDEYHWLVEVHWRASFVKVDGSLGEIEFDAFYLLQKLTNSYKIFTYITGDEQKALKEKELI
jgi:hypothetical protein